MEGRWQAIQRQWLGLCWGQPAAPGKDGSISPQFSLTLWPRASGACQEIEAGAELDVELSWELSPYSCHKFLISHTCLLPLCRRAILLCQTPALHILLPATPPYQCSLLTEDTASVARLGGKSAASKVDSDDSLIKHDICVRKGTKLNATLLLFYEQSLKAVALLKT